MDEVKGLPTPVELRAEIKQAQAIGRTLYLLDRVSAIGTDIMLANVASPEQRGIGGYLTMREGEDRPGDTWLVQFFTVAEPRKVLCRVRVAAQPEREPTFESLDPPPLASDDMQRVMRAQSTALAALGPPAQPQNPLVLPGAAIGEDGFLVYLLAGTTRPDLAVFGQHHRVLVSSDGLTVAKLEPMSKTVLEVPLTNGRLGSRVEELFVTHLVTRCPTETHVFVSLLHRVPVCVGTATGIWLVDGDKISLLDPSAPAPAPASARKPWWRFWG